MNKYMAAFEKYLDEKGTKYQEKDDSCVRIGYSAENMKTIDIYVIFDKDDDNRVQLVNFGIGSFKDDKYVQGLKTCNAMNNKFRWATFCLDKDNDVKVKMDAIVDLETVGQELRELVIRMVGIIDDAYPDFMKALWA